MFHPLFIKNPISGTSFIRNKLENRRKRCHEKCSVRNYVSRKMKQRYSVFRHRQDKSQDRTKQQSIYHYVTIPRVTRLHVQSAFDVLLFFNYRQQVARVRPYTPFSEINQTNHLFIDNEIKQKLCATNTRRREVKNKTKKGSKGTKNERTIANGTRGTFLLFFFSLPFPSLERNLAIERKINDRSKAMTRTRVYRLEYLPCKCNSIVQQRCSPIARYLSCLMTRNSEGMACTIRVLVRDTHMQKKKCCFRRVEWACIVEIYTTGQKFKVASRLYFYRFLC